MCMRAARGCTKFSTGSSWTPSNSCLLTYFQDIQVRTVKSQNEPSNLRIGQKLSHAESRCQVRYFRNQEYSTSHTLNRRRYSRVYQASSGSVCVCDRYYVLNLVLSIKKKIHVVMCEYSCRVSWKWETLLNLVCVTDTKFSTKFSTIVLNLVSVESGWR